MSPTRKPKPSDKADAGHKPSRKVAIDDVLRTLQDLVHNELSVEEYAGKASPAPAANVPPETPPLGIVEELSATALDDGGFEDENITLEAMPASAPEPPAPAPVPPGGLQQELPHLDSSELESLALSIAESSEPAVLQEPEVPAAELPDTGSLGLIEDQALPQEQPGPAGLSIAGSDAATLLLESEVPATELPDAGELSLADDLPAPVVPDEVNPEALPDLADPGFTLSMGAAAEAAKPAVIEPSGAGLLDPPEEISLNDIPTLEDAVEPEELHHSAAPAAGRRLAIQVAARLNVELRKQGHAGLSSDVIARLARLLEEALAKGPANMENSRSVKP